MEGQMNNFQISLEGNFQIQGAQAILNKILKYPNGETTVQ